MYLNLVGDRQSGKTTALVNIAVNSAITKPDQYILFITIPSMVPHTVKMIEKSLKAGEIKCKAGRDGVLLDNGSQIRVIPFNIGATKGRETDCVIIDNIDMIDHKKQLDFKMSIPFMTKFIITSSLKPYKF